MNVAINFDNISFSYTKGHQLFEGLSLNLNKSADGHSSIISLSGKSGCGKSTLLKLAAGLLAPDRGTVNYSSNALRLAYLFQSPMLFDHLSIEENARYLMQLPHNHAYSDNKKFWHFADKLKVTGLIKSDRKPKELSGGERQRIALLQAIAVNPDIILLDEPCTGLDSSTKKDFLLLLAGSLDELNTLAVYVSHHSDEVKLISDRLIYMDDNGSILYDGKLDEATANMPVEVLQFLLHPFYNALFAKLDKKRNLIECSDTQQNGFERIGLLGNEVTFSDSRGIAYEVIRSSDDLSVVKLDIPGTPNIVMKGRPLGNFVDTNQAIRQT